MRELRKAIAIDFDGCLCNDAFPEVGSPHWDVIVRAKEQQKNGAGLILWTCREGDLLQAAIDACSRWGLEFDSVNENLPERKDHFQNNPRKVWADEYWDDRSVVVREGYLYSPMVSPFKNDPFALVWTAFANLYPDKEFVAYWDPMIRDAEDGTPVFGLTDFSEDMTPAVFVKPSLDVNNAVEIFAHELAHVAVGVEHEHDDAWDDAFEAIFREYNRIGNALFEEMSEDGANDCN